MKPNLPTRNVTREEMLQRVAYFKDLKGFDGGPLDVVSFPPGVARRFENVSFTEPDQEHILLFVIGGDAPQAEFSPQAVEYMQTQKQE